MHLSLQPYSDRVEQGLLRQVVHPNGKLVLFGYTDKCTYDKAWDEYTRKARGLIVEWETGKVIARPFEKFFNLGEMPETRLENLPTGSYTCFDKHDGSLGIIYFYDGKWDIATRGSFTSEQANYAREHLLPIYDLSGLSEDMTILTEIIYPENKIVVNYGNIKCLILLGLINRLTGEESNIYISPYRNIFPPAGAYSYTIPEMIALQKTLPKDREGFVVHFANGLRIKIKGEEYLKIHRVLLTLSPLSLWETMKNGRCDRSILEQIPEEYRTEWEPIVETLEDLYRKISLEVYLLANNLADQFNDDKRSIGIYLKENNHVHGQGVFPYLTGKGLDGYIMKQIRPTGNSFVKKPRYER